MSLDRAGVLTWLASSFPPCQVLHPVCHVRALHLWTAVYLPASSPCPLGEEGMDLYLPSGAQSQEFSSRSLDRWEPGRMAEQGGRDGRQPSPPPPRSGSGACWGVLGPSSVNGC